MALSAEQYQRIMNTYDETRRRNYRLLEERKEYVYARIPEIRTIDEQIAHISVEKAKELLFRKNSDSRQALHDAIYDLAMERVNLLAMHDLPTDYLEPIYDCPQCKDTGYIGSEKCTCLSQRIAAALYAQSNIGNLVGRESFASFRREYYSEIASEGEKVSPRENIDNVLDISHRFVDNFDQKPGENLFIYGRAGRGKTFLSSCIAGSLLQQGKSVIYLTAYQLFDRLADYKFRREEGNAQTLPTFLNCDLLIIDDLGTELNNSFVSTYLFLCINERILHKRSTIISTNLSLEEIGSSYTARVSSRIIESYTLLHIYGEDIRIKKTFSSLDET